MFWTLGRVGKIEIKPSPINEAKDCQDIASDGWVNASNVKPALTKKNVGGYAFQEYDDFKHFNFQKNVTFFRVLKINKSILP